MRILSSSAFCSCSFLACSSALSFLIFSSSARRAAVSSLSLSSSKGSSASRLAAGIWSKRSFLDTEEEVVCSRVGRSLFFSLAAALSLSSNSLLKSRLRTSSGASCVVCLYFIFVWEGRSLLEYCFESWLKSPSPFPLPPLAGSKVGLAAVVIFYSWLGPTQHPPRLTHEPLQLQPPRNL
ncbi:hypothetical protein LEMLEM_LOCUS11526, partial [Lemmus lemmus]